jgi:hypothetical protein
MFTTSMFESIKEALAKSETSSGGNGLYREILKFKAGNTYVLRLLPNIKSLKDSFYHYYVHGWNSFSTGEYVSAVSLQTIGQTDPIGVERYRIKKNGTEEEKAKAEQVKWQEQWFVNVYVVDDPVTPENNGTVKVMRFGKKLNKLVMAAISGDDSDEFGSRVFDLSANGCNLKLKAEKQGEYVSYDSSRFTSPTDLSLSEERQKEIYDSIHDLAAINPIKTEDEIIQLWKKHFVCEPLPVVGSKAPVASEPSASTEESSDSKIDDAMVAELLKSFDSN